jgi:hypothetical protein
MRVIEYADTYSYVCGITPHKYKHAVYDAIQLYFKTMMRHTTYCTTMPFFFNKARRQTTHVTQPHPIPSGMRLDPLPSHKRGNTTTSWSKQRWHTAAPSLLISYIDQISETERGKEKEERSGREKGDKTHMSHLNVLIHFLVLRKREERLKEMGSKDLKREEREREFSTSRSKGYFWY